MPRLPVVRERSCEGSAFIGTGLVLMLPLAIIQVFRLRTRINRWFLIRVLPLVGIALLLFLLALGPSLDALSFSWRLGALDVFLPIHKVFRAHGRFFWVSSYLLMFGIVFLLLYKGKQWQRISLATLFLVLQLTDTMYYNLEQFKENLKDKGLKILRYDTRWEQVLERFDYFVAVPGYNRSLEVKFDYAYLVLHGARRNVVFNFAPVAHPNSRLFEKYRIDNIRKLKNGQIADNEVFVISPNRKGIKASDDLSCMSMGELRICMNKSRAAEFPAGWF